MFVDSKSYQGLALDCKVEQSYPANHDHGQKKTWSFGLSVKEVEEVKTYTIGAVATEVGVCVATIRNWEQKGVIPHPSRLGPSRRRVFTEDELDSIRKKVLSRQDRDA